MNEVGDASIGSFDHLRSRKRQGPGEKANGGSEFRTRARDRVNAGPDLS
jgi:hypothetical protein